MLTDVALRVLFAIQGIRIRADDESGQTLAEYSLIVSVIVIAVLVLAVIAFRDTIASSFNSAVPCLKGSC